MLEVDPSNPSRVYGVAYSTFFSSTDGGGTWNSINLPANCYAQDVARDPASPSTFHLSGYIYDGSTSSFAYFRTTNSGTDWTVRTLASGTGYGYAVAVDPTNTQHVYAGGYIVIGSYVYGRIFKSTDGGSVFGDVTGTLPGMVNDILVDPGGGGKIFVACGAGVYRSSNGGSSWTGVYVPSPEKLAFYPPNTNVMFASTYSYGVYKSTDGGATWDTTSRSGIVGSGVDPLVVEGSTPACVFIGNRTGVFRSTNAGASWRQTSTGLKGTMVTALVCAPSSPTIMYAGINYSGVFKTSGATQSTVTWSRLPDFYSCENVTDVFVSPVNPERLYAFEGGG